MRTGSENTDTTSLQSPLHTPDIPTPSIRRRDLLRFAAGLLATPLPLLTARSSAQQAAGPSASSPHLRIDVRLVTVMVTVTGRDGRLLTGLVQDQFRLSEDGHPESIAVFEPQSQQPLSMTLAIDTSASVRKDMAAEAGAARRFAHALLGREDRVSVLEFATTVRELCGFTGEMARIDRALGQLKSDYATALYKAVERGCDRLSAEPCRRVLVVISDGVNTVDGSSYEHALRAALRAQVMIYPLIDVPVAASAGRNTAGEHALMSLAEQSGGRYFYVGAGGLDQALTALHAELRGQYLLGYYPHGGRPITGQPDRPAAGQTEEQTPGRDELLHTIQVTLSQPAEDGASLRYRSGYYSDAEP